MTKLLLAIDRRTRYLDRVLPKMAHSHEPTMPIELPLEPWAEGYRGLSPIRVSLLPAIEKIYGAEAARRGESPLITMIRCAAHAGGKRD